jgi:hypothetical protein
MTCSEDSHVLPIRLSSGLSVWFGVSVMVVKKKLQSNWTNDILCLNTNLKIQEFARSSEGFPTPTTMACNS